MRERVSESVSERDRQRVCEKECERKRARERVCVTAHVGEGGERPSVSGRGERRRHTILLSTLLDALGMAAAVPRCLATQPRGHCHVLSPFLVTGPVLQHRPE